MSSVTVLNRCIGLDNTIDPLTPLEDIEAATSRLASTANIKITKARKIEQGPGNGLLYASVTGGFHSVWRDTGDCYAIHEGATEAAIVRVAISPVGFTVVLAGLTKNKRMEWIEVGDRVYFSNGIQYGYIASDGLAYSWPVDTYNGPPTDTVLSAAPVPDHLAYRNGVILIAKDSAIYTNYVPWLFGLFDLASGFVSFTSSVIMAKAVSAGFFVSDTKRIFFERGDNCVNFTTEPVAEFPANEWGVSTKYLSGTKFGLSKDDKCAVWTSPKGLCVGFPDGSMKLYDKRVTLKNESVTGDAACMVWDDSYVIATFN